VNADLKWHHRGNGHGHGATPVVGFRTSQQTTIRATPGSRRIAASSQFITLIPAANSGSTTSHDVGGVEPTRFFGVHGQRADDMTFNFAGMDSRVFVAVASNKQSTSRSRRRDGAVTEATTGRRSDHIIPRTAATTLGSLRASTPACLSSDNATDELRARGLAGAVNQDYYDVGGGLAARSSGTSCGSSAPAGWKTEPFIKLAITTTSDRVPCSNEPDLSRRAYNHDYSKDASLRLTWQAAEKHKIVASYTQHPGWQCVFAILETTGAII